MSRRHLNRRYGVRRLQRGFWRAFFGAAVIGFFAGLLLGVATGHFILSLVPAVVGAITFAGLSLLLGGKPADS